MIRQHLKPDETRFEPGELVVLKPGSVVYKTHHALDVALTITTGTNVLAIVVADPGEFIIAGSPSVVVAVSAMHANVKRGDISRLLQKQTNNDEQ